MVCCTYGLSMILLLMHSVDDDFVVDDFGWHSGLPLRFRLLIPTALAAKVKTPRASHSFAFYAK